MSRKSDRMMAGMVRHDAKTHRSVFRASLYDQDVDSIDVGDLDDPGLCMVSSTLAMNSSDHGSDGEEPDIWAEVKENEDSYQIDIWDNGEGLPDDYDTEEIFEKGVGGNTGLGLYLARELTETFDGSLEYNQENAEKEDGFGLTWELKKPGQ